MSKQTFQAGRLKYYASEWEKITNDPKILDIVQHCHVEFVNDTPPSQSGSTSQQNFNATDTEIIDSEIKKLLDYKVIIPVESELGQFLSPIFVRPKKNGEYRLILNLKKLNDFIPYQHFKMDTFESAVSLITENMYMCVLDLRHAYYSVPLATELQKYLRFTWKGVIYQFTCIANGLAPGPRLFTKLMKPVYAKLRSEGHLSTGFIDDSLLCGSTFEECAENVEKTTTLMLKLGFMLNDEKSVLVPTRRITYLGNVIDSQKMIILLTDERKQTIACECKALSHCAKAKIRVVAHVIGLLVAAFPAVQFGKLFYRNLENAKTLAVKMSKGNYESKMYISFSMKTELKWWFQNVHSQFRPINRKAADIIIQTDSSQSGWGVVFENQKIGGRWSISEKSCHINVLELTAILFGIKALSDKIKNKHVKILTDSSTAVCYVNNMGGVKSDQCNAVSQKIWIWCLEHNIWLTCSHIPGKINEADRPSREFNDQIEWELKEDLFQKVCMVWGVPSIDLFASRLNNKLPLYCAWKPDPYAAYVDALSLTWSMFQYCYIFPPFSLVSRCIRKIQIDGARAMLIIPLWPTQTWFPMLMKILVEDPMILPRSRNLLSLKHLGKVHPLSNRLAMMACKVSGNSSEIEAYRRKLPVSSCPHGNPQQNASIRSIFHDGFTSVVSGKLIQFQFL
ncbi:MAG: reverse transcriptase domain-containing protein [Sedimenticola sp.]